MKHRNVVDQKIARTFKSCGYNVDKTVALLMRSYHDTPKAKREYKELLERELGTASYTEDTGLTSG
jgi:3-deoxy-D-arabino-heptulosonate 7-phosphate (DAHP) synthase